MRFIVRILRNFLWFRGNNKMDSYGNELADLGNYQIATDRVRMHTCSLCCYEWPSSSAVAECPGCGETSILPDGQVIDLLTERQNIDSLYESLTGA